MADPVAPFAEGDDDRRSALSRSSCWRYFSWERIVFD
jgi:hypothetical protein